MTTVTAHRPGTPVSPILVRTPIHTSKQEDDLVRLRNAVRNQQSRITILTTSESCLRGQVHLATAEKALLSDTLAQTRKTLAAESSALLDLHKRLDAQVKENKAAEAEKSRLQRELKTATEQATSAGKALHTAHTDLVAVRTEAAVSKQLLETARKESQRSKEELATALARPEPPAEAVATQASGAQDVAANRSEAEWKADMAQELAREQYEHAKLRHDYLLLSRNDQRQFERLKEQIKAMERKRHV